MARTAKNPIGWRPICLPPWMFRRLRQATGLSGQQLADLMHTSKNTLYVYERSHPLESPRLSEQMKMVALLVLLPRIPPRTPLDVEVLNTISAWESDPASRRFAESFQYHSPPSDAESQQAQRLRDLRKHGRAHPRHKKTT